MISGGSTQKTTIDSRLSDVASILMVSGLPPVGMLQVTAAQILRRHTCGIIRFLIMSYRFNIPNRLVLHLSVHAHTELGLTIGDIDYPNGFTTANSRFMQ